MVLCRDYRNPNKKAWVEAKIDEVLGDRIYLCKILNDDLIWKRHVNQILSSNLKAEDGNSSNLGDVPDNKIYEKMYIPSFVSESPKCDVDSNSDNLKTNELEVRSEEPDKVTCESDENIKLLDNKVVLHESVENVKRHSLNINERPKRQVKVPVRLDL